MTTKAEYWTKFIGFLAGRQVTIYAQIKDYALVAWAADYKVATGKSMPSESDSHFYVVPPEENKWGCSSSVIVTATLSEFMCANGYSALPLNVAPNPISGGRLGIYSDKVMWDLFDDGFVLGPKQDREAIRMMLDRDLLAAFDTGVGIAKR